MLLNVWHAEVHRVKYPQSNYGMRGQLFLFQNPIMKLKPEQQEICRLNFDAVKRRLLIALTFQSLCTNQFRGETK